MISISRVDGKSEKIAALLKWLQLETLPGDDPIDTKVGYWWIAHDAGYRSRKSITVVLRSKKYGEVGRRLLPVQEIRDLLKSVGKGRLIKDKTSFTV